MLSYRYILISYVIAINIIAYLTMGFDKYKSLKKRNRIPERRLFAMAFAGGAFGIYLGMKAPFYHKAGKPNFRFLIPLCIILNLGFILFVIMKSGI